MGIRLTQLSTGLKVEAELGNILFLVDKLPMPLRNCGLGTKFCNVLKNLTCLMKTRCIQTRN